MPAQMLAQTRPGTRGALLFHAAIPLSEFGGSWPHGAPLQIHFMEDDPWAEEDLPAAREIADTIEEAELFLYPGDRHLFADNSVSDYDPSAAACSGSARSTCSPGSRSPLALEWLHDRQLIPVRVANREHRRHGSAHALDLGVDVGARVLQRRVGGLDVVGRDDDPGLPARLELAHRRRQGHRRRAAARSDLDPAHLPVREGLVDTLLEAERLCVEGDRAILVGGRNRHAADLGDVRLGHAV